MCNKEKECIIVGKNTRGSINVGKRTHAKAQTRRDFEEKRVRNWEKGRG